MTEYKLVPVEPTAEMLGDAMDVYSSMDSLKRDRFSNTLRPVYSAMLDAAPTTPQPIYDAAKEQELFEGFYANGGLCRSGGPIEKQQFLKGWLACAQSRDGFFDEVTAVANSVVNVFQTGQGSYQLIDRRQFDRVTAERDAAQASLTAADERADTYLQILNAPLYYLDSMKHQENPDLDTYTWFRWNGEWRPINKHCLCDILTKSGRLLFNQSPHDFNWDSEGDGDVVLAARHRGPMEGWGG